MPLFRYRALDRKGKTVSDTMDAATEKEVRDILRNKNLIPSKIYQMDHEKGGFGLAHLFEGRIETKTKVLFTRQLSVLLKASVPLLEAIGLLISQFDGVFKRVLISIRDDLKEGKSLADALYEHPKVFNNVYIQLVKAGEASGGLEKILDRLTKRFLGRCDVLFL
ncbi:type II secretion system F family protein [Candidatus Dependentiae bacterium]